MMIAIVHVMAMTIENVMCRNSAMFIHRIGSDRDRNDTQIIAYFFCNDKFAESANNERGDA